VDLAGVVDRVFTAVAPPEVREKLFDPSVGVPAHEADAMLRSMDGVLRRHVAALREPCRAARFTAEAQMEAARRLANVLVRACQRGRSLGFQMQEDALGFMGAYKPLGLAVLLSMSLVGAYLALDRCILARLFRADDDDRVPCECRLCRGDIELGDLVGRGGFGSVFRSREPLAASREGVCKFISVDIERDVNGLQDALNEAKLLIELRHPNIVEYRDVFLHRSPEDGRHACVLEMQFCESGTLMDHVTVGVSFPLPVLVSLLQQLASALSFMHQHNVTHLDVKLENCFLTTQGQPQGEVCVKLGDLGLASKPARVHHEAAKPPPGPKAVPAAGDGAGASVPDGGVAMELSDDVGYEGMDEGADGAGYGVDDVDDDDDDDDVPDLVEDFEEAADK